MAGLSKRFTDAGFTLPKYMLYVGLQSVFNLTVSSFKNYFRSTKFIFIARDVFETKYFIEEECKLLGIENFEIVILEKNTKGQAETVYLGLNAVKLPAIESILIFNIDTIRKGYKFPVQLEDCDGYLEVFEGSGKNWSYAEPFNTCSSKVKRTAEKEEISNLCSSGLYYFKRSIDFCRVFEQSILDISSELYIAPLYNYLIKEGKEIHYNMVDRNKVIFTGIPTEYLELLKKEIN